MGGAPLSGAREGDGVPEACLLSLTAAGEEYAERPWGEEALTGRRAWPEIAAHLLLLEWRVKLGLAVGEMAGDYSSPNEGGEGSGAETTDGTDLR